MNESILMTLSLLLFYVDNPLVSDSELRWYPAWLQNLGDKDDEMT